MEEKTITIIALAVMSIATIVFIAINNHKEQKRYQLPERKGIVPDPPYIPPRPKSAREIAREYAKSGSPIGKRELRRMLRLQLAAVTNAYQKWEKYGPNELTSLTNAMIALVDLIERFGLMEEENAEEDRYVSETASADARKRIRPNDPRSSMRIKPHTSQRQDGGQNPMDAGRSIQGVRCTLHRSKRH